jgi:hypothetical protein
MALAWDNLSLTTSAKRSIRIVSRQSNITAGLEDRFDEHEVHIPKQHLVSMLQVLLQTGRIHLPQTADAKAMQEELQQYGLKVQSSGQPVLGAFKIGQHDDLVTALGLAVYYAEKHVRKIPIIPPVEVGRNARWQNGDFGHGRGLRRLRYM